MFKQLKPIHFAPPIMSQQITMEPGDFDRSFYYNLILQPPLLIVDAAFFTSSGLRENLETKSDLGESWLETALKHGAIQPLFRDGATNFSDDLVRLRKDQFSGLLKESEEIASILDKSLRYFQSWPDPNEYSFGVKLAKATSSIFLEKMAPVSPDFVDIKLLSDIGKFWDRTKNWRNSWIQRSIEFRENISGPGHGLRLSDLYSIAAEDLFNQHNLKVHNALELYEMGRQSLNEVDLGSLRAFSN